MNLEELCITFSQAKKLKELGVGEDSYFYWIAEKTDTVSYEKNEKLREILDHPRRGPLAWVENRPFINPDVDNYHAYTSAEIGEIISDNLKKVYDSGVWHQINYGGYHEFYRDGDEMWHTRPVDSFTEAQARAEFLIYLLENK